MNPARIDVVLLCGGRGSRLGALTAHTPKPLLPVGGEPFLLHLLRRLQGEGFRRFLLAVHYLPDRFREFASRWGGPTEMELLVEPEPLGTGGALAAAALAVRSPRFLAMNGDTWIAQEMEPVLAEHEREKRDFTAVAAAAEGGSARKGVWRIGPEVMKGALRFATEDSPSAGWINAGVYLLERRLAMGWPSGSYSLEERFNDLLAGRKAGLFYSKERLVDIGTPEVYARAQELLAGAALRPAAASR